MSGGGISLLRSVQLENLVPLTSQFLSWERTSGQMSCSLKGTVSPAPAQLCSDLLTSLVEANAYEGMTGRYTPTNNEDQSEVLLCWAREGFARKLQRRIFAKESERDAWALTADGLHRIVYSHALKEPCQVLKPREGVCRKHVSQKLEPIDKLCKDIAKQSDSLYRLKSLCALGSTNRQTARPACTCCAACTDCGGCLWLVQAVQHVLGSLHKLYVLHMLHSLYMINRSLGS